MATWRIFRFREDRDLYDTLNGAINCPQDIQAGVNVDGLTLVIDAGAGSVTVTFAPAKGRPWTAEEIVDAIETTAGLAGVASFWRSTTAHQGGQQTYLRLGMDTGTLVTLKGTGTANALFGWPAVDVPGVPYLLAEVKSVYMVDNKTWYAVTYK